MKRVENFAKFKTLTVKILPLCFFNITALYNFVNTKEETKFDGKTITFETDEEYRCT